MKCAKTFKENLTFAPLAVALLAFIVYASSLGNDFAFDDEAVLTQNAFVKQGVSGISTILRTGSWDGYNAGVNMHIYRPVQLVVLALQHDLFNLHPFGYHLVNVLSYCALCVLVYWLLIRLFKQVPEGKWLAFLSTVLFTAHPIHTEVVANIKGNGDLLAMLFGVVSLHVLWNFVEKRQPLQLILLSVMFLLALLTKETIVCLVGIAFLMVYFFSSMSLKKSILCLLPMLVSVGIYLTIRSVVFGENAQVLTDTQAVENVVLMADGLSQQIGIRLYALGKNLQLLAYPYPLVFMYVYNSVPMVGFWDIRSLFPLFIYILLGISCLVNFKKNNIWGFAIGFYFVALALFTNTVVGIPNIVSERWLLLPSLGFCIGLAYFLILLWKHQKAISLFLFSIILFGYSGYTIQRNFAWRNNLTLSGTDIKNAPESIIINGVLANMLLGEAGQQGNDRQLLRRSAYHYEKALSMNPSDYTRMNNLGLVYEELGEHRKAAMAFRKVQGYASPIRGKARFSEAKNWYLAKDYTQALTRWIEVYKQYPKVPEVSFYLAKTYEALGYKSLAISNYHRVLALTKTAGDGSKYDSIIQIAKAKIAEKQ